MKRTQLLSISGRTRLRHLLIVFALTYAYSNAFGQCGSGQSIWIDFPMGTCSTPIQMLIYDDSYPDSFILYEKVDGMYWQQRDVIMNYAPPVWYSLAVSQPTVFGMTAVFGGCESTMKEFTITPRPAMPSVSGQTQLCHGQSTTLTASGGSPGNYRWYKGSTLISGATGAQYNTGSLTSSQTYQVSVVASGGCEGQKRPVSVTVTNPVAPTPRSVTRCGPGSVLLSTNNGTFDEYQWYNQDNALMGTTPNNGFTVHTWAVTSYKVKVKQGQCWSAMSSSATVSFTHDQPPTVYQAPGCGPGPVTLTATYNGPRAGDYYFEWYTSASGGTPEYSIDVDEHVNSASYTPYLTSNKDYWVAVYDPYTSSGCRTERTHFQASPGTKPVVWASGYSCSSGTAQIQAQGNTSISRYYLFYGEMVNGTMSYSLIDDNSTGEFSVDDRELGDSDLSKFYIQGRSSSNCYSGYSPVNMDVIRPAIPTVTGNRNPCYNTATVLTASGGQEGSYRWYKGSTLLSGQTGAQLNTGPLTESTSYYVSYIASGTGQCESPKRLAHVTVQNPSAPTPNLVTRCGPGSVPLSASGGFSEYQWYDQSNSLLGTTTAGTLTVSAENLTSYRVRVKDAYGCLSGMSASAPVTITHSVQPMINQSAGCGPNTTVTMFVTYDGDRAGDYFIEWYTTAAGGSPVHTEPVSRFENSASYSVSLPQNRDYWVAVHDPQTSFVCRTERKHFLASPGSPAPGVSATGYSCEYDDVYIQAQGPTNISSYSLYRWEDRGSGFNYYSIGSNAAGTFAVHDFYSDDPNYESEYYVRGQTSAGCWTGYTQVQIDVLRPPKPTAPGTYTVCHGDNVTLTASGGVEGQYRWYNSSHNLLTETGSQLMVSNVTGSLAYYVSQVQVGLGGGQCESEKKLVNVQARPIASVGGFSVSPGTEFYGGSPPLTLSHTVGTGAVTYERSKDGANWSVTASPVAVSETTQFRAKALVSDCPVAYSDAVTVFVYPSPVVVAVDDINYVAYDAAVELSTGPYHSYQWMRNGQPVTGATQQTFSGSSPGMYTVQVKGSSTAPQAVSQSFRVYSDPVEAQNLNYISTTTFLKEGVDAAALHTVNPEHYTRSIAYFDGLGRAMQRVVMGGTAQGFDLVQPIAYDAFGREAVKYLPYAKDNVRDGRYVATALSDQSDFYQNPSPGVAADPFPQSVTVFEPSPLNRVFKQGAPGAAWQPVDNDPLSTNDHTVKTRYTTNGEDEVLLFRYDAVTETFSLDPAKQYYEPAQLFANKVIDEHGNEVIEYNDKEGKVVCKKVQYKTDGSTKRYATTYYVHDYFGQLVGVFPPELIKRMEEGESLQTLLNDLAFRYKYDGRRRMTHKKVPGAEWVYMVYDNRDRLVMAQDGNQRSANPKEWLFTKYDALNRPILTGTYRDTQGRDQPTMQGDVNAFYAAVGTGGNSAEWYEEAGTDVHGYTNQSFPEVSAESDYLTVTYYDHYDFRSGIAGGGFGYDNSQLPGQEGDYEPQESQEFESVKGQVTGTRVKNLETHAWYYTVNYYDDRYRLIQSISQNHKGGIDKITNVYDFPGRTTRTKTSHTAGGAAVATTRKFAYDHAGRLKKVWHKTNNQAYVLIAANEYNELGQLMAKSLHNEDSESAPDSQREYEQTIDYRYNIRGWLTSVNDPANPGSDLFTMTLNYNSPTGNGGPEQYNGNISEMIWKSSGTPRQSFGYYYDTLNRIKEARYFDLSDPLKNNRFNEVIGGVNLKGYDLNGNIEKLSRQGRLDEQVYGAMDDLTYTYHGNQLTRVDDAVPSGQAGFTELVKQNDEYLYDANGNLTEDKNKGITSIAYNHLNLPRLVTKSGGDQIVYVYDATGRKLSQVVTGTENKTSDYLGDFFYEDNDLKFIHHEEGRVVMASGIPEYQYHLKDHLGNVRLTFTTARDTESGTATLEPENEAEEYSTFVRYTTARKVQSHLFDRTNGSAPGTTPGYAQRLSGGDNEEFGLARSLSVMPGDTVRAEVYAKYVDPESGNWSPELTALIGQIATQIATGATTSGLVVDGADFGSSTVSFPFPTEAASNTSGSSGPGPKAYLNWLVFDHDRNLLLDQCGYKRLSSEPKEAGQDVAHERLFSPDIPIHVPGYVYIYLSNEEETPLEVYFDDFTVEHVQSSVVGMDDYYPFGLTFNSYRRENSVSQKYLYNGKELQDELKLDWFDYGARMYDPVIGRWMVADPLSEQMRRWSPYNYVFNNPLRFIDPDGMRPLNDHYINNDGSIQTVLTDDNFDRFFVEDNNSESGYRRVAQLDRNDAGLVRFPDTGSGFDRYGTEDAGGRSSNPQEIVGQGDHFVQPETAAALFGLTNVLNIVNGFTLSLGDMSASNGSDPWQAGFSHHAGHGHLGTRSGLDVDFRYLNTDGVSFRSANAFGSSQFSIENNQRVYDAAKTFGFTINYQGTNGNLSNARRVSGHNDHGHLGLNYLSLNWRYVPQAPQRRINLSRTLNR